MFHRTGAPQILCLGEAMVMVTPREPVPLAEADLFRLSVGGAESTVALYLSEMGHDVAWVSRVGADPLGDRILDTLARAGVDTSLVDRDADARTGVYFKDPDPDGTCVYYYRDNSAASLMGPATLDRLQLTSARLVHFSGITPGLSSSCAELASELVRRVKASGTLLSFDVNHRRGIWSRDVAAPILLGLSREVDIVFVGLDEAQHLWGTRSADDVRSLVGTANLLIVKDGAVGATEFDGATSTFVPALDVQVVEPVGAGDAFAAGYLSALLGEETPAARLSLGHATAARALASTHDFVPRAVLDLTGDDPATDSLKL
jgi:2-dehydro-3-deoxygluconokinase